MRLNRQPIFLVGFVRGGSHLFLNLLRSHPNICSPRGETQQVFKGKASEPGRVRLAKRLRYLPILLREGRDIFATGNWEPRPPLSPLSQRLIDAILFYDKLRARGPDQNLYKIDDLRYTLREIARARLLTKNLNGLIFLSREFAAMYQDATFITLIRNGFAVCEGHIRRGYDLVQFASNYERACQRIIADQRTIPNYHVVRYEDLLKYPMDTLKLLFEILGLNLDEITKIRIGNKRVMHKDGAYKSAVALPSGQLIWYNVDEFMKHLLPDANENQIQRLSKEQKHTIADICQPSLKHFGYWEGM